MKPEEIEANETKIEMKHRLFIDIYPTHSFQNGRTRLNVYQCTPCDQIDQLHCINL